MKFNAKWLWAAASAAGLATVSTGAFAAGHGGHSSSGGHWGGAAVHGGGHWAGGSGGHWNGGHWNGGHWNGGHYYGGYRGWGGWHSSVGFYFGLPLFWGPWWDPFYAPGYYAPYYYPSERVVYREVIRDPDGMGDSRQLLPRDGGGDEAPMSAPASSPTATQYCPSSRAYFPQVRTCAEGWQSTLPTN